MVNCWHMNKYESAAMWNLYTKTNESICLQSTYEKLKNCLSEKAYIGKVQYIDYNEKWMSERNLFIPFMHKRKSFEYEQEIRALIDRSPKVPLAMHKGFIPPENGIWEKVNLKKIIEKIYVAPESQDWFEELIRKVSEKYDLDRNLINKSSLDEEPFF